MPGLKDNRCKFPLLSNTKELIVGSVMVLTNTMMLLSSSSRQMLGSLATAAQWLGRVSHFKYCGPARWPFGEV